LTIEEHSLFGGLGSLVSLILVETDVSVSFKSLGFDNTFPEGYGTYQDMKKMNGLSKDDFIRETKLLYERKMQKNGIVF
ncbi:MAG: transketolase, partial [Candidatus Omnitrophica bacterium]|nr:transketolase [Candidatus Omnitrophota bacterium]